MLIKFSVENFKSIYKRLELSFIAESLKQHEETNLIVTGFPKLNLLKALAIYGANSSGKTNLIKAMSFMKDFVLNSALNYHPNRLIKVDPYRLIPKAWREPSYFEIEIIVNENRYRYGFEVTEQRVEKEYLYSILKTTEKMLFERTDTNIEFGISFNEGYGKEKYIKPTSLFLSVVAQLNGPISSHIIEWFNNLTIITDQNYPSFAGYTAKLLTNSRYSETILKLLKEGGLDFDDVELQPVSIGDNLTQFLSYELNEIVQKNFPEQLQILIRRKLYDLKNEEQGYIDFDLKEESAGSQKFFAMCGPIVNSLVNGYPIIIDELDARIHYKLVYALVKLYCSDKFDSHNGQILYSNHMLDLMDRKLLRRDQILILSKIRRQTEITSIHKEGARSDKSFKSDYLSNEFGGIPDIEFNQLDLFNDD